MDEVDVYGTFTPEEAKKLGIIFVSSVDGSVTLDEKPLAAGTGRHTFRNDI